MRHGHRENTEKLRGALQQLNRKIEEARRKKNLLIARQRRAEAQMRIHETMSGLTDTSAFESFERMAAKVEDSQARAAAAVELGEELSGEALEKKFTALEQGQDVEQALAALKAKMGKGDTFGKPTTLPWAISFTDPQAMAPLGVSLHPIQIYELLAYLAVFLVVQRVARSATRPGAAVLSYAVLYGAARFAMEFFRGDPPMVAGIIVPQVMAVLLLAAGVLGMWLLRQAPRRPHGTLAG